MVSWGGGALGYMTPQLLDAKVPDVWYQTSGSLESGPGPDAGVPDVWFFATSETQRDGPAYFIEHLQCDNGVVRRELELWLERLARDGACALASLELCMVGTGTEHAADGSLKLYPDVVLRLHVLSPPSLADPFVSGNMEGSPDLLAIRLLAYAEGDHYNYGSERAACSPGPSGQTASGSLRALGGVDSVSVCARLKEQLMISYKLKHGLATFTWMHVNQMQCSADGATVRAYAVLLNDTATDEGDRRRRRFLVGDEALVADGHWDQAAHLPRRAPAARAGAPAHAQPHHPRTEGVR
ncbi:hypothetical protein D1007_07930 [Hordeum vulgare]|nr:hypothetical protein D1007_07930 [Hordeum vulgare]